MKQTFLFVLTGVWWYLKWYMCPVLWFLSRYLHNYEHSHRPQTDYPKTYHLLAVAGVEALKTQHALSDVNQLFSYRSATHSNYIPL